jgi:hypothetical protein
LPIVLIHSHWLMLNIGRFSIDERFKDEQFVHQDPTHRHFIAIPPTKLLVLPGVVVRRALMQPELPYRFQ